MKIIDLPIGSKVKFGKYSVETEPPEDIIWQIVDKNHEGYPDNSCTLMTEKIIDLRAFDAIETNNPDYNRQNKGNNFYKTSNINQWLNSNKQDWYMSQHEYDEPPINENISYNTGYDNHSGFLYNFTKEEINILLETNISFVGNAIELDSFYDINTKVFLPSGAELGFTRYNDGFKFEFFTNDTLREKFFTEQCFNNTKNNYNNNSIYNLEKPWTYWTRSPDYPVTTYNLLTSRGQYSAKSGLTGVAPICNISLSTTVTETSDEDGCYKVILDKPKYCLYKKGGR